jgi:hypothetical protein
MHRFVQTFLKKQFPSGDVPEWVQSAMEVAGIDISMCCSPYPQGIKKKMTTTGL